MAVVVVVGSVLVIPCCVGRLVVVIFVVVLVCGVGLSKSSTEKNFDWENSDLNSPQLVGHVPAWAWQAMAGKSWVGDGEKVSVPKAHPPEKGMERQREEVSVPKARPPERGSERQAGWQEHGVGIAVIWHASQERKGLISVKCFWGETENENPREMENDEPRWTKETKMKPMVKQI